MKKQRHLSLNFPYYGMVDSRSYAAQPEGTTPDLLNVRNWEPTQDRGRGGQRPGLTKLSSSQVNGSAAIQDLISVAKVRLESSAPGTVMSLRDVRLCVVAGGSVFQWDGSTISPATNGSTALDASEAVLFSAELFGKVYFADGTNAKYWDLSTNTVSTWTASAGTLPINGTDRPRLIENWYGRIVQAGVRSDPHNWYMSKVGDATDWDTTPDPITELDAVVGNSSNLGKTADTINGIVPIRNDVLLFGCDHSLWQMTGNPLAGGRLDEVSRVTGMAFGRPWCIDPHFNVYFFGSRGGLYVMQPGSVPRRLSAGRVDRKLQDVDLDSTVVRLAWSDAEQGVYMLFTPLGGSRPYNYFWDARQEAFYRDRWASVNHYPHAVYTFDGDRPDDRVVLLGSKDGYIRHIDLDAKNDDGEAIESYAYLGPIRGAQVDVPFIIAEVQPVLGNESGANSTIDLLVGDSPEDAYLSEADVTLETESGNPVETEAGADITIPVLHEPAWSDTIGSGRADAMHPRRRGNAAWVKIGNSTAGESWQHEYTRVRVDDIVTSKRRSK